MANKSAEKKIHKTLVAMSGGVDSAVAAALLKSGGYEVTGIFFQMWKEKKGKLADGLASAKNIAKILNIPFKTVDISQEFQKEVIEYTLREFQAGRTPNPCCICNPKIKFELLIKLAKKYGADFVATGHYARHRREFPISPAGSGPRLGGGNFQFPSKPKIQNPKSKKINRLYEAMDKSKDQSYFLYGLKQKQLEKIIFPLGNFKKTEVKTLARQMKLPVFDRPESHDVCFVPGKLEEYLKEKLKFKKGDIINIKGDVLGKHQGLPFYTIGQRKGIELGGKGPYYVRGKNHKKNTLIVTGRDKDLFSNSMSVRKVNWIGPEPTLPLVSGIRIRYGHPAVRGIIKSRAVVDPKKNGFGDILEIQFKKPQRAITSGQAAVFYGKRGELLGGGTII